MSELIQTYSLEFHDETIANPCNNTDTCNDEYLFGVLSFTLTNKCLNDNDNDNDNVNDTDIINNVNLDCKKHIHFVFNIDHSGSMDDECKDGRTKMRHIIYTLENMLKVCYEKVKKEKQKGVSVSIYVQIFDDIVTPIITNVTNIEDHNITDLIEIIRKIEPLGSTNIGEALDMVAIHINDYTKLYPDNEIIHILLTDGEITCGAFHLNVLKAKLPELANCTHIFIGYGKTHDSKLLSNLANVKRGHYRFVDILENAGLVYGEIIHGIFYKVLDNVTLVCGNNSDTDSVSDVLIYNYATNEWTHCLELDPLSNEQKKDFQIKCLKTKLNTCTIMLKGNTDYTYTFTNDLNRDNVVIKDLTNYLFRQRTQELLFKSREMEQDTTDVRDYLEIDIHGKIKRERSKKLDLVREQLKAFHKILLGYIKDKKDLELDNTFLTNLADDIYICYKTLGTNYGGMFTYARQLSQGKQQTYTCSSIHDEEEYNNTSNYSNDINDTNLQIPIEPFKCIKNRRLPSTPMPNKNKNKKNKKNNKVVTPFTFVVEEDTSDVYISHIRPSIRNTTVENINDFDYNYDEDYYTNYTDLLVDNDIDTYTLSKNILSPYRTSGIVDMMSQMSKTDDE
uniref:VWFA domain-containing protein n=1 Tax=viral metagenome TaxID=1070528 RepID=A0A6C0IRX8_9ZZZZ